MDIRRITAICGLVGPTIILVAMVVAAINFRGLEGEHYSPLNHFISELGEVQASEKAAVFNVGLIVGGLVLAAFMIGLGFQLRTKVGFVATAFGVIAGLSASAVGVIPMDDLPRHVNAANWFFRNGLMAIAFFAIAIHRDRGRKLSRWLVIPAILSLTCFVAFLSIPILSGKPLIELFDPHRGTRPPVWLLTIFEWAVFVTIAIWTTCASIELLRRSAKNSPSGAPTTMPPD